MKKQIKEEDPRKELGKQIQQARSEKPSVLGNIKNMKRNWNIVRSSPYLSLVFRLKVQRAMVIGLILLVGYNLIMAIINFRGGGYMSLIGRGALVIVLCVFVLKAWQSLEPIKQSIEQYKKNPPKSIEFYSRKKAVSDIDEILNKFEKEDKNVNIRKEKET